MQPDHSTHKPETSNVGADGNLTAIVVLRSPEIRVPAEPMQKLAPFVVQAAKEISDELGYRTELLESA